MALPILVTPTFARAIKKLHPKDKLVVDKAVQVIANAPTIGEEKKGAWLEWLPVPTARQHR